MTADPGDFSGTSEAYYILDNLRHRRIKRRDTTVCGSSYSGTLLGQQVLVVTTGGGFELCKHAAPPACCLPHFSR